MERQTVGERIETERDSENEGWRRRVGSREGCGDVKAGELERERHRDRMSGRE